MYFHTQCLPSFITKPLINYVNKTRPATQPPPCRDVTAEFCSGGAGITQQDFFIILRIPSVWQAAVVVFPSMMKIDVNKGF